MQKIVGVSFNKKGRIYNFNANTIDLNIEDTVIVETEKGLQYGFVMTKVKEIDEYVRMGKMKDLDIDVHFHSMNPVGIDNMRQIVQSCNYMQEVW